MPRRKSRDVADPPDVVFVDSSGWLAFLSRDDRNHGAADSLMRRAIATRVNVLTTSLVLAEVHRLLLFRAGIRPARVALDKITGSRAVKIEYPGAERHRDARRWLDKLDDETISLADAVSFAVMNAARCRVAISFDHAFWIAGFELWR